MFSVKLLCVFGFVLAVVAAEDVPVLGGITPLGGDRVKAAENALRDSLAKLAAGDGPHYRISKIISASHQVVSGSLYRLNAELIDQNNAIKKCNVNIWSQPWLENGIEVTFECDGEPKLVKKHSA